MAESVAIGGAGADTFIFDDDFGTDTVTDLSLAEGDVLRFDDALWTGSHGALSTAQVVAQFSSFDGAGNVVPTFSDGETVTLDGVTSTVGLAGAMEVF